MAIPENVLRWKDLVLANHGEFSPALLLSMIYHLSQGRPDAQNEWGARGLFLIDPNTAADFNVAAEDLVDPETAVRLAVELLDNRRDLIKAAAAQAALWDLSAADFLRLTIPAYWWGPVPTITAISQGAGPSVESIWDATGKGTAYADFANRILSTAAEFQEQLPSDMTTGDQTLPGTTKPDTSHRAWWVLGGLAAIGLLAWWDSSKGKKKGKKRKRKKRKR